MDRIDQQIGARLSALREMRGLTQRELAQSAGVEREAVAACETGAAPADVSLIVRLARALGGSAADLIGNDPGPWCEAADDLARDGADGWMELALAFSTIPDSRVRRAILDLAWTLIEAQDRNNPAP